MALQDILKGVKSIHFIGIGGSGMIAVVQILKNQGFNITGSDNNESDVVRFARSIGVKVSMQQKKENINGADLIIYTEAILENNEELLAAKASGIKTIERNDFLAYFTKKYNNTICICGTHGKTTTTSMIVTSLLQAKKDPSAIIGGKLNEIGGYSRLGKTDILVVEACEFKDHFLKLFPDIVVLLNIDNDHLEYFKTMDNLKNSFRKFCTKATKAVIYNGDDLNSKEAVEKLSVKTISVGFNEDNDYYAADIIKKAGNETVFSVYKNKKKILKDVKINIPGVFNVLNALAAIVVSLEFNCFKDDIVSALKSFKGAGRRFELIGKVNGVTVLDDYAHHPSEVLATLKALKDCNFNRIWAVHQPFTFSRTNMLKKEFAKALSVADFVVLTEILGSREKNEFGISSKDLVKLIPGSVYKKTQEEAKEYVLNNAKEGDVVITMGCGDIYKCAKMMVHGRY